MIRGAGAVIHLHPRAGLPAALVIAPTRELALQVARELEWLYAEAGARIATCVGGMDPRREAMLLAGAHPYALTAAVPGQSPDRSPPATQWFMISDLGLASYAGSDGMTVVVRGLSDAGPRAGVTVQLLSRGNAVLGTARTDDQGIARFDAGLVRGTGSAEPAVVTALVQDGGDAGTGAPTDMAFSRLRWALVRELAVPLPHPRDRRAVSGGGPDRAAARQPAAGARATGGGHRGYRGQGHRRRGARGDPCWAWRVLRPGHGDGRGRIDGRARRRAGDAVPGVDVP